MKSINDLLEEYGESHQHPVNKIIHWICVPLIVWSLLGFLWFVSTPSLFNSFPVLINWAVLLVALSMIYYLLVSKKLAMGILLIFIIMLFSIYGITQTSITLWKLSAVVFVLAWIGQFIGHSIEGKRPSFLKDIQFLLIGPLWLLSFMYRRFGVSY
ncbi:MAG: Mpo1 family 2-hydroxy fatty acid dioxygenase [Gammaproteobacteria bacterium]|jgi:uncharacterized membrane protein YGL010W